MVEQTEVDPVVVPATRKSRQVRRAEFRALIRRLVPKKYRRALGRKSRTEREIETYNILKQALEMGIIKKEGV